MTPSRVSRILIVTDVATPSPELVAAVCHRRAQGPAQFRVVVPNPARRSCTCCTPSATTGRGRPSTCCTGSSTCSRQPPANASSARSPLRHDPMDAVEEVLFSEPIDEIMLHVAAHGLDPAPPGPRAPPAARRPPGPHHPYRPVHPDHVGS